MKARRTTLVELKSEVEIYNALCLNFATMTNVWKTADTSTVILTGPTSLCSITCGG